MVPRVRRLLPRARCAAPSWSTARLGREGRIVRSRSRRTWASVRIATAPSLDSPQRVLSYTIGLHVLTPTRRADSPATRTRRTPACAPPARSLRRGSTSRDRRRPLPRIRPADCRQRVSGVRGTHGAPRGSGPRPASPGAPDGPDAPGLAVPRQPIRRVRGADPRLVHGRCQRRRLGATRSELVRQQCGCPWPAPDSADPVVDPLASAARSSVAVPAPPTCPASRSRIAGRRSRASTACPVGALAARLERGGERPGSQPRAARPPPPRTTKSGQARGVARAAPPHGWPWAADAASRRPAEDARVRVAERRPERGLGPAPLRGHGRRTTERVRSSRSLRSPRR
jgi:hypothetical protein